MENMSSMLVNVAYLLLALKEEHPVLLVMEELTDNIEISKRAGMRSVPITTHRRSESFEETIGRLIDEETGLDRASVMHLDVCEKPFYLIPRIGITGRRRDIESFYGFGIFRGDVKKQPICPKNKAVMFAGWMEIEALYTGNLRVEVPALISDYQRSGAYARSLRQLFRLCDPVLPKSIKGGLK